MVDGDDDDDDGDIEFIATPIFSQFTDDNQYSNHVEDDEFDHSDSVVNDLSDDEQGNENEDEDEDDVNIPCHFQKTYQQFTKKSYAGTVHVTLGREMSGCARMLQVLYGTWDSADINQNKKSSDGAHYLVTIKCCSKNPNRKRKKLSNQN